MRSCVGITVDDYPCLNEGTVQVGTKCLCDEHAMEELLDTEAELIDEPAAVAAC